MTPLVIKAHLDAYKYVADSVKNLAAWPQYVNEAQTLDVKHWLGDALLNELMTEAAGSPGLSVLNEKLLAGGEYTYQAQTYLFSGLREVIIYYAFARFTSRSPYNYTQAGVTIKESDFSQPASDKAIQRLQTEAYLNASSLKDEIVLYLRRNASSYPLFKAQVTRGRPRTFYVIGD